MRAPTPFGKLDFWIAQGGDFRQSIRPRDSKGRQISLDGWRARMQGRKNDDTLIFDLTEANLGSVVDFENNRILLTILASETTTFDFNNGVYDLEIFNTANNETIKLLSGKLFLQPEVTR